MSTSNDQSPLDLDAIRKRAEAVYEEPRDEDGILKPEGYQLLGHDVPALLAEIDRLRSLSPEPRHETDAFDERLVRDAIMLGCVCHEGPDDMTMHGGGPHRCPVCELADEYRRATPTNANPKPKRRASR